MRGDTMPYIRRIGKVWWLMLIAIILAWGVGMVNGLELKTSFGMGIFGGAIAILVAMLSP